MDFLYDIKVWYAENVDPLLGPPRGATYKEVNDLEQRIGFELPEAYRQFLLWMGNDENGLLMGHNWFINDVISNTEWLPELIRENSIDYRLPDHYLAFFGHQGYVIAWFVLPKTSDNPPIYFFSEGRNMKEPHIEYQSFTEILIEYLQRDLIHIQRNLQLNKDYLKQRANHRIE